MKCRLYLIIWRYFIFIKLDIKDFFFDLMLEIDNFIVDIKGNNLILFIGFKVGS